ncbi:polysaccharide pyruvyl transferase family protein [Sinomicrobium sp. M5D2P17]
MKKKLKKLFPGIRKLDLYLKLDDFRYFITNFFVSSPKDMNTGAVLLLPPTNLSGSFGDELMVAAFVEAYYPRKVTIYTDIKIERPDILSAWDNVDYKIFGKYHFLLKEYSEVHVLGADNMDGEYGEYRPLQKIKLLSFASRKGLKASIKGFSLNNRVTDRIKSAMIKGASLIKYNLRDIDSYMRAKEFLPANSIIQVADIAFLCPKVDLHDDSYEIWVEQQKKQGKLIAGICPNAIQARKLGLDKYLEQIEVVLRAFQEHEKCAYAFLYHDTRTKRGVFSDKDIAEMLFNRMKLDYPSYYTERVSNGIELKPYLNLVDFTFTGRMHFGVSGLSLKKPMLGVSYQDKFTGLVKLFGADPKYTVLDYTNLTDYQNVVKSFFEHLNDIHENVIKNHPLVIDLAKKNFE